MRSTNQISSSSVDVEPRPLVWAEPAQLDPGKIIDFFAARSGLTGELAAPDPAVPVEDAPVRARRWICPASNRLGYASFWFFLAFTLAAGAVLVLKFG